jgi:molybdopterin-containing oxidoreductase family iron-sulfur binding subunit
VNATVHSDEGINEMVYNRCIGTRYCSNNCPVQGPPLQLHGLSRQVEPVQMMQANPERHRRSRGVMEKCTYCVQRIERKRIDARVEGRAIAEGRGADGLPAGLPGRRHRLRLAQRSRAPAVSKLHEDERRYNLPQRARHPPAHHLLWPRIRNPNPELA